MEKGVEERAHEIFFALVDLPVGQRGAVLAERCDADPELRTAVESLLSWSERASSFLETPPNFPTLDGLDRFPIGTEVGPYRIDREIGRGGMGVVYAARVNRRDQGATLRALSRQPSSRGACPGG